MPLATPSRVARRAAASRHAVAAAAAVLRSFELQPLEPRVLYSAYDIQGVQPAALDQPQINVLFRDSPTGNPLGGDGPDDGLLVKAFLDTGSSGILMSLESAENLPLDRQTYNGEPVQFSDVGVAGDEGFDVSTQYYGAMAPVRSIFEDGIPVEAFDQSFGPVRMQINQTPADDFLSPELNIIGMPGLQGKVVVMDPTPLNSETDLDGMQTYVYSPGTPANPGGRGTDPGIPNVNRHVKLSYGDFGQFTQTTPAGAPGPTLKDNPFIGPNPVAAPGAVDNTPPILMTNGTKSASGSFLLDTGAAASFVSQDIAGQLGVHYRDGTYGSDDPILVDANNVPVPNQFQLPIGGIGGAVTVAGFRMSSLSLPTVEGDPIRFLDAPVMVLDITVTDPTTGVEKTLDGDFGMNFLVASIDIDGTSLGEGAAGAFDWLTFDQPNGILGLDLPDVGAPPPAVTAMVVGDGSAQRSMVTSLTVDFDAPVTSFDPGAFALTRRSTTGGAATAVPFSATLSSDGLSATLAFSGAGIVNGSLADGKYDLVVNPSLLHGADGQVGVGAAQTTTFHRLFGDQDGNTTVNNADNGRFRNAFGSSIGDAAYNPIFDYDGNGTINNLDNGQFRNRFGTTIA